MTAAGIVNATIYAGNARILEVEFDVEYIIAPMANELPFKFLIGRNLLDQLDAYFFGKKQLVLLKLAE